MPDCLPFDEQALLSRIANSDETAFRLLFNRYHPKIYSLSMHPIRSETIAEDMVQEVFAKVWEKREQLNEINYINAWLRTIARNICCDFLRRLAIEKLAFKHLARVADENLSSGEALLIESDQKSILDKAIRSLSPQQQKVYLLSSRYGMKQAEIAAELNISVYTVKEYKKLALRFIRSYIQKHIDIAISLFLLSQI